MTAWRLEESNLFQTPQALFQRQPLCRGRHESRHRFAVVGDHPFAAPLDIPQEPAELRFGVPYAGRPSPHGWPIIEIILTHITLYP